eukprot:scaffold901_cov167-Amphora_coffeaeformis.AAC.33
MRMIRSLTGVQRSLILRSQPLFVGLSPQCRPYFRTAFVQEPDGGAAAPKRKKKDPELKKIAQDFNNRRASYKRQVSLLRREYAEEVAEQRAADKAEQEALEREATRRRLERQRQKNIRSAYNAMREKEMREKSAKEFEEHLEREQIKRDARKERYAAARQKVVDELEKEAPMWLTTPEEIEAAFTPEAEQLLWARRGGVLGAPNPSLDAHFWQNETHTWHMTKTYKSQREILLEEIHDLVYEEVNIDMSFWTPERIAEVEDLETRARLRTEIQKAGKAELLRRQAQMISEQYQTGEGEIPKRAPAPNLKVLANSKALEREGAKLMFADPTRFFIFDEETQSSRVDSSIGEGEGKGEPSQYAGPTLGAPVAIRKTNHEKFPQAVGMIPKPDTRTEREKKQEAREERMLAAARAEEVTSIDLAADEQEVEDLEPDLDYDNNPWDPDEEEWTKGLREDSPEDEEIRNLPASHRFQEEDVDWVLQKLDKEQEFLKQQLSVEIGALQQNIRSDLEQNKEEAAISENDLEMILLKMSDKELIALSDLDDAYSSSGGQLSAVEFSQYASKISSLTEDQLRTILDRERE